MSARSGVLEPTEPTQTTVHTMSPYNLEFSLWRIFSTTTGWSYPPSCRALRPQQPSLLHNTASSLLDFGGNQTMHPLQISPLLKEGVRWFVWARAGSDPAAACCLWYVDGMADNLTGIPRDQMTIDSFQTSCKGVRFQGAFSIDLTLYWCSDSRQHDSTSCVCIVTQGWIQRIPPSQQDLTTVLPIQEPKTTASLVIGRSA